MGVSTHQTRKITNMCMSSVQAGVSLSYFRLTKEKLLTKAVKAHVDHLSVVDAY